MQGDKDYCYPACYFCGAKMVWSSDFNYDEVFGEGEGIVSYWTCSNCGAEAQYSLREEVEDGQRNESGETKEEPEQN